MTAKEHLDAIPDLKQNLEKNRLKGVILILMDSYRDTHILPLYEQIETLKARTFRLQSIIDAIDESALIKPKPTTDQIEDKIQELFESNYKEFKGSNEGFLHFKEELADWIKSKL